MKKNKIPINEEQAPAGACLSPPALTLDTALYEKYLEDSELTEKQKEEFLETLWSIMVGFVDLGFGIHPVQQVYDHQDCGQEDELATSIASHCEDVLGSQDTINDQPRRTKDVTSASSDKRIQS